MRETLRSLSGYGGVLFDLDGTLYRGDTALPGAADFVRACRDAGLKVAFGTNNALLERDRIAARLQGMGIDADPDELVTAPDRWPPSCRPQGTRTSSGSATPACARAWSAWASRRRT